MSFTYETITLEAGSSAAKGFKIGLVAPPTAHVQLPFYTFRIDGTVTNASGDDANWTQAQIDAALAKIAFSYQVGGGPGRRPIEDIDLDTIHQCYRDTSHLYWEGAEEGSGVGLGQEFPDGEDTDFSVYVRIPFARLAAVPETHDWGMGVTQARTLRSQWERKGDALPTGFTWGDLTIVGRQEIEPSSDDKVITPIFLRRRDDPSDVSPGEAGFQIFFGLRNFAHAASTLPTYLFAISGALLDRNVSPADKLAELQATTLPLPAAGDVSDRYQVLWRLGAGTPVYRLLAGIPALQQEPRILATAQLLYWWVPLQPGGQEQQELDVRAYQAAAKETGRQGSIALVAWTSLRQESAWPRTLRGYAPAVVVEEGSEEFQVLPGMWLNPANNKVEARIPPPALATAQEARSYYVQQGAPAGAAGVEKNVISSIPGIPSDVRDVRAGPRAQAVALKVRGDFAS